MNRKTSLRVNVLRAACVLVGIYLIAAYVVFPKLGERKALLHPDLLDGARLTHTGNDLPGDPLNISLIGTEEEIVRSLVLASWRPADALSFRSSVRIVVDTVLSEPDPNAPVSNLYLYGRREDLAFEKPIGHSPRERNHVRFWKSAHEEGGRPIWMGAATHDVGVELSRTTEQVTHRIALTWIASAIFSLVISRRPIVWPRCVGSQAFTMNSMAAMAVVIHGTPMAALPWACSRSALFQA